MAHPLDGCRAKLDWAEQHLDALSEEMKTFFEGNPDSFVTEFDEANNSSVVFFKEVKEIPITWGIALGDIIHNMRSTLDHLVYELVELANGRHHRSHQFPILDHPNDWTGKVVKPLQQKKRGLLDFVDTRQVAVIKSLQPYQPSTGLPRLTTLRRFSNTDKHRLIHAARAILTGSPEITAFLSVPSGISDLVAPNPDTPLEDGAEVARFRNYTDIVVPQLPDGSFGHPENSQMNVDVKFPTTTVFGEPGAEDVRGREFRRILGDVRGIVERFAPDFP